MAKIQQINRKRKANDVDTAQKEKSKKEEVKTTTDALKTETTEEVSPISKYKEWKLLYVPYPFRTTRNNVSSTVRSEAKSLDKKIDSGEYKGLCANCRKHETCTLVKPEGVWHCEEYE